MENAFFTVSATAEMIRDSGSGSYIRESGMYDVTVKRIMVNTSNGGSVSLDLWLNYEGTDQVLYSAIRLKNNDGGDNFQMNVFNKMLICIGAKQGDTISQPVEMELPIGKDKAMKSVMVLPDIEDVDVVLRIQMEYGSFNGKMTEHKSVRNCFRKTDHASASEIINGAKLGELGKQYAIEANPEVCKKNTFKNGVTQADVDAYLKGNRASSTGTAAEPKAKTFSAKGSEQLDDLPF